MRPTDVLKRLTGFGILWLSAQWNPTALEGDVARRVLAFLEDRRVFYVHESLEVPAHCVESVLEIRKMLSKELGELTSDSVLKENLRGIRAACHRFLKQLEPMMPPRSDALTRDPWARAHFGVALGELRSTCGIHIAIIASTHHVSVDGPLVEVLPVKLITRNV